MPAFHHSKWGSPLFSTRVLRCLGAAALGITLAACNPEVIRRGYVFDEATLTELKPGTDVQSVLRALGQPSTVSTVGNQTFYYISQTTQRRFQFMNPTITDQRVLVIYFDKNFKVERVANYGLQDGVVFDFISRTTPSSGQEQSFVGNLLRGVTRFSPLGV